MATGTGNLPNPGMSFTPFDILTAAEQNDLVENIESLATGTGIGDGSVDTAKIADDAVTADKIDFTTFSTTENTVGTWLDGSTIYRKTVNFGAGPNNTLKTVPHGITGLNIVVDIDAIAVRTSDSTFFNIPSTDYQSLGNAIDLYVQGAGINIKTGSNRSTYTIYVTLYYTKV